MFKVHKPLIFFTWKALSSLGWNMQSVRNKHGPTMEIMKTVWQVSQKYTALEQSKILITFKSIKKST